MKKAFVLISCFAVVLILSKVSFAQPAGAPAPPQVQLSVERIVAEPQADGTTVWRPAAPQALPFGYLPYPTVDGRPAFGVPYSFPRTQPRRLGNRLAPPPVPFQPHPLPVPGATPGVVPVQAPPMVAPPMTMGQMPQRQGVLGVASARQAGPQRPIVVHRPTPVRNFMALMTAPRPYIGYDPFAGYPPFPGYVPPSGLGMGNAAPPEHLLPY